MGIFPSVKAKVAVLENTIIGGIVTVLMSIADLGTWEAGGKLETYALAPRQENSVSYGKLSDEALVFQLVSDTKHPDQRALEELIRRYDRELFSYLRRYTENSADAEDAFQQTFIAVYQKADQFERGRRFHPWLYTIATNQAIDILRRQKRHKYIVRIDAIAQSADPETTGSIGSTISSTEPEPETHILGEENAKWVREHIERLSKELQQAVQLVYYQGMKYREAAEELSIPVGTIKSRLHAAILKLQEAWNAENN